MTFRTTFRDSLSSRQIALIDLQSEKYARRIFAIVSTISIPASASQNHGSQCGPTVPGSRLDADHPENGVPIARRLTVARGRRRWIGEQGMLDPARLVFIDETAASTNMVRLRGRAPRGVRLIGRVPLGAWETITFVAALRHNKMSLFDVRSGFGGLGRSRKSHLMWHISPASSSCSTGERPSSRPDLRTTLGQRAQ